jgi:hypothetical protein
MNMNLPSMSKLLYYMEQFIVPKMKETPAEVLGVVILN